ncbi:hypothetical protein BGZ65_003699, partial [Modicella reniformis]
MPAANLPPMTASSAVSTLEVNLRRLMAKCDAKVHSSDKILQGSDRTKYTMNIKALKEMLANLEDELTNRITSADLDHLHQTKTSSACIGRRTLDRGTLDKAVMKEYSDKVESLASFVEGLVP